MTVDTEASRCEEAIYEDGLMLRCSIFGPIAVHSIVHRRNKRLDLLRKFGGAARI